MAWQPPRLVFELGGSGIGRWGMFYTPPSIFSCVDLSGEAQVRRTWASVMHEDLLGSVLELECIETALGGSDSMRPVLPANTFKSLLPVPRSLPLIPNLRAFPVQL